MIAGRIIRQRAERAVAYVVLVALGIVCILVGLVLLVWPRLRSSV